MVLILWVLLGRGIVAEGFFLGGVLSSNIEIGAPDTIRIFPIKFQVSCCWLEGYFRTLDLHICHIFTSLATAAFILDKLMGKMTRLLIFPAAGLFLCVICYSTSEPAESQPGCCLVPLRWKPACLRLGLLWSCLLPFNPELSDFLGHFYLCHLILVLVPLLSVLWPGALCPSSLVLILSSLWIHSISLVSVMALLSSTQPRQAAEQLLQGDPVWKRCAFHRRWGHAFLSKYGFI